MDLSADHILVVFLLTTLAGLATGIGGFIAFFMKRTDTKALTFALGLSGGVMVYISLVELLGEAQHRLIEFEGHTAGSWIAIASFFGGIAVAALIDYLFRKTKTRTKRAARKTSMDRPAVNFPHPELKGPAFCSPWPSASTISRKESPPLPPDWTP